MMNPIHQIIYSDFYKQIDYSEQLIFDEYDLKMILYFQKRSGYVIIKN